MSVCLCLCLCLILIFVVFLPCFELEFVCGLDFVLHVFCCTMDSVIAAGVLRLYFDHATVAWL